jgi:hypothetical protein
VADEQTQNTWVAVYPPYELGKPHDGKPLALFADADEAQRYRRTRFGVDSGLVATVDYEPEANQEAVKLMRSLLPTPTPMSDPSEVLRNQLRSEEMARREREQIMEEVKQELDQQEGQLRGERLKAQEERAEANRVAAGESQVPHAQRTETPSRARSS